MLNWIHHASRSGLPSLLLSTDAEKAFYRVSWDFIKITLSSLGLRQRMMSGIMSLYSAPSAAVTVNGHRSTPFDIKNGTRQGCPLSPIVFVITLESLLCRVRANPDIQGLKIKGEPQKVAAFADDLIFCEANPQISLPCLLKELAEYGRLAGYKIHFSKSEALNLTLQEGYLTSLKKNFKFKWAQLAITYLGTQIPFDIKEVYRLNFAPLIGNIRKDLEK